MRSTQTCNEYHEKTAKKPAAKLQNLSGQSHRFLYVYDRKSRSLQFHSGVAEEDGGGIKCGWGAGGGEPATELVCLGEVAVECRGKQTVIGGYPHEEGCLYTLNSACDYTVTATFNGKAETQTIKQDSANCGPVTSEFCFFGDCPH